MVPSTQTLRFELVLQYSYGIEKLISCFRNVGLGEAESKITYVEGILGGQNHFIHSLSFEDNASGATQILYRPRSLLEANPGVVRRYIFLRKTDRVVWTATDGQFIQ